MPNIYTVPVRFYVEAVASFVDHVSRGEGNQLRSKGRHHDSKHVLHGVLRGKAIVGRLCVGVRVGSDLLHAETREDIGRDGRKHVETVLRTQV